MHNHFPVKVLVASILASLPLAAIAATNAEVDELRQQMHELTQRYESQNAAMRSMAARLQQIEASAPSKGRFIKAVANTVSGDPENQESSASDSQNSSKVVKEAPPSSSAEAVYQEQHVLFDRKFTLETGLSYSHSDRRDLFLNGFLALDAIFLGKINLDRIKADIWTADVTGRYGVSDRLQVDINVPYLYRKSNFSSVGAGFSTSAVSEASVSNRDIGDASAGVFYRLFKEDQESPDTVLSFRVKAPTGKDPYGIKFVKDPNNTNLQSPTELPTGNGVWSLTGGVSFIKTVDPAILFANFAYTYNLQRSFSDISSDPTLRTPAKVDLGNQYSLGAGIAFALNERMSLSMSYAHRFAEKTRIKAQGQGWQNVTGSDSTAGSVNFGVTYGISDRLSMIANVGVGVTPDSPDISVGVRFPYNF